MKFIDSSFSLTGGFFTVILITFTAFQSCSQSAADTRDSKIENTQYAIRNTKYASPDSQQVHSNYAQGFEVSYHKDYKLIKVFNPFVDQSDTLRYLLVPRGKTPPDGYPNAQIIRTPVQNIVVTGTMHVALAEMLNATEVIAGIAGAKYVYNSKIREKLEAGEIVSFNLASLNKEKIIAMNPDLIMISAGKVSAFNDYQLLMRLGIPVFVNADWLETTPLGRAEWVKVMAALLNKEALANKKFKAVAANYNRLKELVEKKVEPGEKPVVINNLPYKGAWFVSGGSSFTAQYLKDAGADYPWYKNDEAGGHKLDFEAVYYAGLEADVWINPGAAESVSDILAKDSRFSDFKSIQTGRVYNNNKRMNPNGGNDFWETGVVRPDLVLHDLINIFHPALLENDTLYFYQQLKRSAEN